ncbi:MAG: flavodoxin, partial [Tissierellia bacterium]|nr:flavodoxin [Tissierellia bacterium]
MKKKAIIYCSYHHLNTKKLVDSIENVDLFNVKDLKDINFEVYDLLGFASGIYAFQMSNKILEIAKNIDIRNDTGVFIIYTCGLPFFNYAKSLEEIFKSRGIKYLGKFVCRGYDTFGPFKYIGGLAKGHPNEEDDKGKAIKGAGEIDYVSA